MKHVNAKKYGRVPFDNIYIHMLSFFQERCPKFLRCFIFDMIFFTFPVVFASYGRGVNDREFNKFLLGRFFCIPIDKCLYLYTGF